MNGVNYHVELHLEMDSTLAPSAKFAEWRGFNAPQTGERVLVLEDGKPVAEGRVYEVKRREWVLVIPATDKGDVELTVRCVMGGADAR